MNPIEGVQIVAPPVRPVLDSTIDKVVTFFRSIYGAGDVPLHRPVFSGNERTYLAECIDSNFVSSVGARVTEFERRVADFTGALHAVATVNGTAALHVALQLAGVERGDEVITQALTFVAGCNAILYAGARPVFVDVEPDTMGMSPGALQAFINTECEHAAGGLRNRRTGRRIAACVPMHTFGQPARITEIAAVCSENALPLIEDAAESLGSYVEGRHTGTFGTAAAFSFNGNKIITTGGGGMIITDDESLAKRAKHLTTTAKLPHRFEFVHDQMGYNYRMPNLNAALGCAQIEQLPKFLAHKQKLATLQGEFFAAIKIDFFTGREGVAPNHWLNAVVLRSVEERNRFLDLTNAAGIMTRPVWTLMTRLPMFADCQHDGLATSIWLEERVVNVPSSVPDVSPIGDSRAGGA